MTLLVFIEKNKTFLYDAVKFLVYFMFDVNMCEHSVLDIILFGLVIFKKYNS